VACSCEGFGSFAFMNTTKCVSAVKRDHLAFRIATVSAVRIGLRRAPGYRGDPSFLGRDSNVFAHDQDSSMALGSKNASIRSGHILATPEY